jgi:4-amino-4-deoxy-L-arabinose transferase-like glycosyltransferase
MKPLLRKPVFWIAAAFVLLNLPGLGRSPVVWIDEVTLNDPAKELALHGVLRSSVFAGHAGFETSYFWQPPGQALVTALVYRVFGFGIWQTRLPPLLFGAACLVALHSLGLLLFRDARAALLGAAVFGLDPKFLQAARSARMDPQCLFLALLALLVYLRAREDPAWKPGIFDRRLALSGLLLGLAGVTHPIAVAWAPALGSLIVLSSRGWRRLTGLACFGLAAALPPLLWLAFVLRSSSFAVFTSQFLAHGEGHLAQGSPLQRIAAEVIFYCRQYSLAPLLVLTYAAAFLWLLLRPSVPAVARQTVGILVLVLFVFNALVMTKGLGYYYLYPTSLLALGVGAVLVAPPSLRPGLPGLLGRSVAWGWALLLILNVLAAGLAGRLLSLAFQWQARDYRQVDTAVAAAIPAGSVVWGPPEVWYAVEEAGSSLRLLGPPDPRRHDYLVLRSDSPARLDGRLRKISEFGTPLPPVFGIRRASADYCLQIWTWDETRVPGSPREP